MVMQTSNRITVGRVGAVYGVRGWVKIHSYTSPPEKILDYQPWQLKTRHGLKTMPLADSKIQGNNIVCQFAGFDDREDAKQLTKVEIVVESTCFPSLAKGEYYWHQLEGLQVVSLFEGKEYPFGKVERMLETGANDVLIVKGDPSDAQHAIDDKERLIPYLPGQSVIAVELDKQQIVVHWDPEF
ncbi:ribosome maturation factor RimM [Aurantivibrio infirmus]